MGKFGRPTKYKKEYCELLVQHMSQGLSFESFAGEIDVNRDTVHEWATRHKDFSEAKRRGEAKSRIIWEKILVGGATGKIKNYNATSAIFALKNKFPKEWRDRKEIDVHTDDTERDDSDTEDLISEYENL